jgi:hypothetical protein
MARMTRDPYSEVRAALARQRAAERDNLSGLEKYTRVSAASLSVDDLARVVADVIKDERHNIIGHVHRLFELGKISHRKDDTRFHNLHARLTQLESEVRLLKRGTSR